MSKILVVDDEPRVAFFLRKHLEMVNEAYQIESVNSGFDALQKLKEDSYDLMITDLQMPKMSGLELLRQTRTISPNTKTILITAYGTKAVWREAEKLDTFRALSKPFPVSDLLGVVREALAQNKAPGVGVVAVTGDNVEQIYEMLEELRISVGARGTILANNSGNILVSAGSADDVELSTTLALLGGTMAASGALIQQLNFAQPIHLSFFEGPPYNLYATNVGESFFLLIIQDQMEKASKIGLVWLYTRRLLEPLLELLGEAKTQNAELESGIFSSIQNELDDLFDDKPAASNGHAATLTKVRKETLTTRIAAMLSQFEAKTGIVAEHYLDELERPFAPNVEQSMMRILGFALRQVYKAGDATLVGFSCSVVDGQLNGRFVTDARNEISETTLRKQFTPFAQSVSVLNGSLESELNQDGFRLILTLPVSE